MYNYENEYAPQGYETNYEFNPQYESEFQDFEGEFDNEYQSQPFNMEENYEAGSDYEGELPRNVIVRDHRNPRPVTGVSTLSTRPMTPGTRPGLFAVRPTVPYYKTSYYRPGTYYRPGYYRPGYNRPASNYYRYPYYRYRSPYYSGYRRPWWYNRYPGGFGSNLNVNNMDQSQQSQPFSQTPDSGGQPTTGTGSNFILESIQRLSRQIANTNANVEALQQSIAGGGKQEGAMMPPPDAGAAPGGGSPAPAPPGGGQEMEDYEYREMGDYETGDYEYQMENGMQNYEESNEITETELAAELLATNNEMELDQFLESLVGGGLKNLFRAVIKKTLPVAGAAAGGFFGGPMGATLGAKIGSAASGVFELELEGLSNEDQEFEVARAIVRLANDTATELAEGSGTGDPNEDARNALIQSAMRNAPGLLVRRRDRRNGGYGYGGQWRRRGNKIVIENAF